MKSSILTSFAGLAIFSASSAFAASQLQCELCLGSSVVQRSVINADVTQSTPLVLGAVTSDSSIQCRGQLDLKDGKPVDVMVQISDSKNGQSNQSADNFGPATDPVTGKPISGASVTGIELSAFVGDSNNNIYTFVCVGSVDGSTSLGDPNTPNKCAASP